MTERFYPAAENLDKDCQFWDLKGRFSGCNFPKIDMEGRTSCEGVIDNFCLYLKDGRIPSDPDERFDAEIKKLKIRPPKFGQKPEIPPGTTS